MLGGQEGESKGHHNARAPDAQRKFSSRGPNRVRPPGLPAQGLGALEGMLEGQAESSGLQASGRGRQVGERKVGSGREKRELRSPDPQRGSPSSRRPRSSLHAAFSNHPPDYLQPR